MSCSIGNVKKKIFEKTFKDFPQRYSKDIKIMPFELEVSLNDLFIKVYARLS